MGFGVWGLGFRVSGLGFGGWGLAVWGLGVGVLGVGGWGFGVSSAIPSNSKPVALKSLVLTYLLRWRTGLFPSPMLRIYATLARSP